MLPLIGLAISLVPELIRLIGGDKTNTVAARVSEAVSTVAGTADPVQARARLQDPATAAALRARLVELALQAQKTQSDAETAQRRIELEELRVLLAQHQADNAAETQRRDEALRAVQQSLTDTQNARATLVDLAARGSEVAWGAPVVSLIIAVGFFAILGMAVFGGSHITDNNKEITYILIGTMATSFATMVSFWLGSSQGSRNKDAMARRMQASHDDQTSRLLTQLRPPSMPPAAPGPVPIPTVPPRRAPADNFVACLHEVFQLEGGYSDDPRDPGGPTNFGITRAELADVRRVPIASISPADMQALSLGEAASIYRARYWNAMRCDDLARGVDLMVFQFGVNCGVATSGRVLQQVTGARADGIIGPLTLAGADRMPPTTLIQTLATAQLAHYRTLAEFDVYGHGWTNRVDNARTVALTMAQ